jgi:plasmid stabilization system protein ParE
MKKLIDIPMRDLEDLLDWHASQAERYEKLEKHHAEKYAAYPKHGGSLIRGDQMRATFHRRAVKIVATALDDRARAQCKENCTVPVGQTCCVARA